MRVEHTPDRIRRPVSRGRAARLALLGLCVGLITYPVYLMVMLFVGLWTIPAHCSVFASSSDCQDQNANRYLTITLWVLVTVVFIALLTLLLRVLVRRRLRSAGLVIAAKPLAALCATLAVIPGVVAVSTQFSWGLVVLPVVVVAVGLWCHIIRRVGRAEPLPEDSLRPASRKAG